MVKFSCQSKLFWMFGSNSKFKIQTFLLFSELWWLITSSYRVHFQLFLLEKLHILVLFLWLKFHINPRRHEWLRSILVEGGSTIDVISPTLFYCFLTFQNYFVDTMSQLNEIFFTNVFICWIWITLQLIFFSFE